MTELELNPLNAVTLQEQLTQRLRSRIESGELKPDEKIPSENELTRIYGVSRVTVRAALEQLVCEGLLVKRQGKGTFVRKAKFQESVFTTGSFTDTCLRIGAAPSTSIISIERTTAPAEVAARLCAADGGAREVIELTRLRCVDGVPCIVEVDYFPASFAFLLEEDLADSSILGLIRAQTGIVASRFEDTFHIACATDEQAEVLDIEAASPLLKVKQTVFGANGDVLYVNHQFIVTERYVYAVRSDK